ncbi:MAG TPA: glycosyltransferase [Tenuifilaceae bacterium]|nr:glycosyltransferase [Tenuifilaceae bacterium]
MKLSVVIVNYNVKFFLEQCLISVYRALKGIDSEVFVVDNASADGSCQMVKQRFPSVQLIENKTNYGFSYANNQAIRRATGEFILLLNPDTVVEEDTFSKCISFMDSHPEAGSLSVKMIDGKGRFLPESKRALPSPMVSFYKIFGLARLFPKSRIFSKYHLGYLDENQTHEIEILPGAFMFMRKSALDKVGLLDETFFMYGEDIDLSFRILKGGYKNYYFPETTIIHYKGESTKKGSINYVLVFYKAMMIFARKHFTRKNASMYIFLIYIAIYFRAFLSISKRFFKRISIPVLDAILMFLGFWIILPLWEQAKFHTTNAYPDDLVAILTVSYVATWILSCWMLGAYDKPQKLFAAAKGVGVGTLVILAGYALLPDTMRFSRAIILLSAAWSLVTVQTLRFILATFQKDLFPSLRKKKRIAIVGNPVESRRVQEIISEAGVDSIIVGEISPTAEITDSNQLATIDQLPEFSRVNGIDEVIFCSSDISSQQIIRNMLLLVGAGTDYKIAPPDSLSVIGSNSIDTAGDLYSVDISAISKPENRRSKRIFDVAFSLILILLFPVVLIFIKNPKRFFRPLLSVMFNRKTWIGYIENTNQETTDLPKLKKAVFAPLGSSEIAKFDEKAKEKMNILYAKNYSFINDLKLLWNNLEIRL